MFYSFHDVSLLGTLSSIINITLIVQVHFGAYEHMTSFLKLLLYAQLHETESLRALSDCVFSEELQNATQLDSISFSQLGRRLNLVPTEFFQTIFLDLVKQIHRKTDFQARRKTTTPLKIIDSSTLPLNLNNHKWAKFRKTKSGVKLHLRLVFMEKGHSYPDQSVLTNANEHDRGQLEILVDDKECMYVFDRGYLDYERFDRMTDEGYFFVSRLRKMRLYVALKHSRYQKILLCYRMRWSSLEPHKIDRRMFSV